MDRPDAATSTGRLRRAVAVTVACAGLLAGCGSDDDPAVRAGGPLVPPEVVATYLDRAPLPPFDPDDGLARLLACDEDVRPVWRTTMSSTTAFEDVREAWGALAEEDARVEVTDPVTFRDGRVHVGLRDGPVRAGATRDRFDERSVLVEVRMPCRDRLPSDPAPFALADAAPADLPGPAFPPQPEDGTGGAPSPTPGPTEATDPLVVDDDTSPATTVPVQPRDPIVSNARG